MIWNFIAATALVTLMPGPSLLLIAGASMRRGWRAGAAVTLGVVLADAVLLLAVLGGLGTLASAAPVALSCLKWLGAAYLLYLGAAQWRSAGLAPASDGTGGFRRGLATTLLNPKIIVFLALYFPQFIRPNEDAGRQMLLLGPLFLLTVLAVFLLCAAAARGLRGIASGRGGVWLERGSACCLIACGLYSAVG
ncbi:LysE family translocator [Chromobacterium violaceum]|uniref:LysE family translocator n=1 Tax=Chromobacterium violaceum TaxID=536 RepID=UPI001E4E782E|nr:LysE family translocator [Chromobacterium violaceum]MCD0493653.1 LysE family translocator [Chromobacterium violaceum]